jgi:hypothetical protein
MLSSLFLCPYRFSTNPRGFCVLIYFVIAWPLVKASGCILVSELSPGIISASSKAVNHPKGSKMNLSHRRVSISITTPVVSASK